MTDLIYVQDIWRFARLHRAGTMAGGGLVAVPKDQIGKYNGKITWCAPAETLLPTFGYIGTEGIADSVLALLGQSHAALFKNWPCEVQRTKWMLDVQVCGILRNFWRLWRPSVWCA